MHVQHLTAFAHGAGLPAKTFTGFMHHCDWVATIVEGAAGGKLIPDGYPPSDSMNMWPTMMDKTVTTGGPRKEVVMNVDPTNQGEVTNGASASSSSLLLLLPLQQLFPSLR